MALKLIGTYSKRLGLPAYSSHQFSVTIETELTSSENIAAESSLLYALLQNSVDQQIQETGFVPPHGYGLTNTKEPASRGDHGERVLWHCTDRQRELILKIIAENGLEKDHVEAMSREMFNGLGVKQLEKAEASDLIKELFTRHGKKASSPPSRSRRGESVPGGSR